MPDSRTSTPPRAVDEQSLVETVREVVAELHPHLRGGERISLDSSLDRDLGLDSLSRMELLARLERRFGATIPETVMANAETARELLPALLAGDRRRREAPTVRAHAAKLETVDAIPTGAATLLEAVDFHARHHGDSVHVELCRSDGGSDPVTFAALVERAEHIAAGLAERGLEPGQSAALMLPTGLDYLATFLAVQMTGAIPVPIYPPAPARPARGSRTASLGHPRERAGADARHVRTGARGLAAVDRAGSPGSARWSRSPSSTAPAGTGSVRPSTNPRRRSSSTRRAAPATPRASC